MNMQGIVDGHRRFLALFFSSVGATNDSEAWAKTELFSLLERDGLPFPAFMVGDAAYGLTRYMMSPFRGRGNLSEERKNFNHFLSQVRVNVECAFGMLVQRWGILWRKLKFKLDRVPRIIAACARLHNLIINHSLAKAGGAPVDAELLRHLRAEVAHERQAGLGRICEQN